MTIPIDQATIDNLQQIAELNKEAGDWQYSGLPDYPGFAQPDKKPVSEEILKKIGSQTLPK